MECPPNGQGLAALMILRSLAGYRHGRPVRGRSRSSAGGGDQGCVSCPRRLFLRSCNGAGRCIALPVRRITSPADPRKNRHGESLDTAETGIDIEHRDTVYVTVVDRDLNAVSLINSLFYPFGSGIYARKSGVLLHNRGWELPLPCRPSQFAGPRKRPMHTIIPGMLMKSGRAVMPFGVMGGHYQASGHANFLSQCVRIMGMGIQAAAEDAALVRF